MLRVLVGIPWRPQPSRRQAHDLTVARYRELLPGADLIEVDTRHKQFCRAACRNEIVRRAETGGYDVVVIGDADTLPQPGPPRQAIQATGAGYRHPPHPGYRSLARRG